MKLIHLFWASMIACIVYAFTIDIGFGLAYFGAIVPLMLGLVYCRKLVYINHILILIVIIFLWVFYLFRPLFLIKNPSFYKYGYISPDILSLIHI